MDSNKSIVETYEATSSFSVDSASLKWKIKNVTANSLNFSKTITSPKFSSSDSEWELEFDPSSLMFSKKVFICLRRVASKCADKKVRFKINFLSKNGVAYWVGPTTTQVINVGSVASYPISGSAITTLKSQLLLDHDTLRVFCELSVETKTTYNMLKRIDKRESISVHPTDDTFVDNLVVDFKNVFEKKKYCDVVLLSSDDQKFPAHKAILEERSPVFAAMFQHDMTESRDGEVRIEDVDGSTLKHLLQYMYTARIDEMPVGVVSMLYVAADKYNMENLKKLCIRKLLANISVNSVCDAIVLADMYKEERLKETAMLFFRKNAFSVIKSDSWKDFVKKNAQFAADILQTVLLSQ